MLITQARSGTKTGTIAAWLWRWWNRGRRADWSHARRTAPNRFLIGFVMAGLEEPIVDQCYADALAKLFDDCCECR
jgi:hypothetical protein